MKRGQARGRGEAGFVLADALIATAIIALMTAVTVQAVAGDARIERGVQQRRVAVLVAQSALARAVAGDGADSGRFDGGRAGSFGWQVTRAPYAAGGSGVPLERVAVRVVAVASGRTLLTLQTLKVAP